MACPAPATSPDLLKKLAHQRLDEAMAQAEREKAFGSVIVEVSFQNGWPHVVKKLISTTEKAASA